MSDILKAEIADLRAEVGRLEQIVLDYDGFRCEWCQKVAWREECIRADERPFEGELYCSEACRDACAADYWDEYNTLRSLDR